MNVLLVGDIPSQGGVAREFELYHPGINIVAGYGIQEQEFGSNGNFVLPKYTTAICGYINLN
ncbi:MAG: hypothetical protein JKY52_05580 [Flavobacteriales bacterium]|nr:hypothetical protein [Flavobacteriales bacterium]